MREQVVVLGAGYAGVGVIQRLQSELDDHDVELIWVSDHDHHFVLHEAHRIIRKPYLEDILTIPVERIKSRHTTFHTREVDDIDNDGREIEFADGSTTTYDYVVDCLGSRTAFYGIDGLSEHARTLKSRSDALAIREAITEAAREASHDDPVHVVVGGAGLSGIQSAGEIAALRDARRLPVEIHLVEAMGEIFPGHSHAFQGMLEDRLDERNVKIQTDAQITTVADSTITFGEREALEYDVFLWTGGIRGIHEVDEPDIDVEDERVEVDATLQSDDERLFALGDAAIVDQEDGTSPPPTAQAAWNGAEVAAGNVARAIRGQQLDAWQYEDSGTLVSVGDDVVAHNVPYSPVTTFGGPAPRLLKKAIGARWLATAGSWRRAVRAWSDL